MRLPLPNLLLSTAGLFFLAGAAEAATTGPLTFDATSVVVDDFIGTLNVAVVDDPEVVLTMTGAEDKLADIAVRLDGSRLVLRRGMGATGVSQGLDSAAYPVIDLRVPAGTPLTIDDMDGKTTIGDLNAPVRIYAASLDATIGDVTTADIDRFGSGDIVLGKVAGALTAMLSGSGDIRVLAAGTVDVKKRGSGDVILGTVSGTVTAEMRGSGDIRIAAARAVDIKKRGSGDVDLGQIGGRFDFESAGIGDVDVGSVNGPVTINATSSGKIYIHGGSADPLRLSLAEYSDFTFDGVAVDPDISTSGASIIKLQEYVGDFKASGAGDIRVAGNRVYPLSRLPDPRSATTESN